MGIKSHEAFPNPNHFQSCCRKSGQQKKWKRYFAKETPASLHVCPGLPQWQKNCTFVADRSPFVEADILNQTWPFVRCSDSWQQQTIKQNKQMRFSVWPERKTHSTVSYNYFKARRDFNDNCNSCSNPLLPHMYAIISTPVDTHHKSFSCSSPKSTEDEERGGRWTCAQLSLLVCVFLFMALTGKG